MIKSLFVSELVKKLMSSCIFARTAINHIQSVDAISKPANDQRSALFAKPKE